MAVPSKDNRELTPQEKITHRPESNKQKLAELQGLIELECFQRILRSEARNLVDARWVITWKRKPEGTVVKCRITMRGFKDKNEDLLTYAGTATSYGQRVVNCIMAQHLQEWVLFSLDVSKAFAKGLSFEELARLTGEPLRRVEFEVSKEDAILLKQSVDLKTSILQNMYFAC